MRSWKTKSRRSRKSRSGSNNMKKTALRDAILTKRSIIAPIEVGSPKIMEKPNEINLEAEQAYVQPLKTPVES